MKISLKSIMFAIICGIVLLLRVPSAFALSLDETAQLLSGDGAAADEVSLSVAVFSAYSDDGNGSLSESAHVLVLAMDDDDTDTDEDGDDTDDDDTDEDDTDEDEDDTDEDD